MRFFRDILVKAALRQRGTGFSRMPASTPFLSQGFSFCISCIFFFSPPFLSDRITSVSLHFIGQQSSWDSEWCLMNNLLILIRPAGQAEATPVSSSSLCCQQPDDKQSCLCVEKRRLLTSRQAGGIKPAMIKGPFSKSLPALHGRTLWSCRKDYKWRRRRFGGGGTIFLSATASEMRCAWSSLREEGLNSFNLHVPAKNTTHTLFISDQPRPSWTWWHNTHSPTHTQGSHYLNKIVMLVVPFKQKNSQPCDEQHISALRWGFRYTLPPSSHLPAWHHAPAPLIRLGCLEVHGVAAMRFGLVPAEVSGLEYTLTFESGGKKGKGNSSSLLSGKQACAEEQTY